MGITNSFPINNQDAKIDFVVETGADFIGGNYTVFNIGDMNSNIYPTISSNISLNFDRLNNATYALANKNLVPANTQSTYNIPDNDISFDANGTYVIGNTEIHNYSGQNPIFVNVLKYYLNSEGFINKYFNIVNGGEDPDTVYVKYGAGALSDVFIQAASASLFKKYNKMSAITNDFQLRTQSLSSFGNTINEHLRDTNALYNTSTIFAGYFHTNRYEGNTTNLNTKINYNLDGINFVLGMKLNGYAKDLDVSDYINDNPDNINILNVFGNHQNLETKVQNNGYYQMNILFRFAQKKA